MILSSETTMGLLSKIKLLSKLKFWIQFIERFLKRFNEYSVPVVERYNKLLFLSKAKLLSNCETVLDG